MSKNKENGILLLSAKLLIQGMMAALQPLCERIQIAGSVRRQRPRVNDLDFVLIPKPDCMNKIKSLCLEEWHPLFTEPGAADLPPPKWGDKMASFNYKGMIGVDLYFANECNWPILLLIRTGSKNHNIFMCTHAKSQGKYLAADGSGLYADRDKKEPIGVETEGDIFGALDLPYFDPEDREVDEKDLHKVD